MMITRNRKQIAVIHIADKWTLYFDSLINFVYYRHLFPISDKKNTTAEEKEIAY